MIDRQEIMDFSREFGLEPNVIEKDYVLGWALAGIAAHPEISQSWVFKGGLFTPTLLTLVLLPTLYAWLETRAEPQLTV